MQVGFVKDNLINGGINWDGVATGSQICNENLLAQLLTM